MSRFASTNFERGVLVAIAIGTFLPWLDATLVALDGYKADRGLCTLIAALIGLGLTLKANRNDHLALLTGRGLLAVTALGMTAWFLVDAARMSSAEFIPVHPGVGVFISLGASGMWATQIGMAIVARQRLAVAGPVVVAPVVPEPVVPEPVVPEPVVVAPVVPEPVVPEPVVPEPVVVPSTVVEPAVVTEPVVVPEPVVVARRDRTIPVGKAVTGALVLAAIAGGGVYIATKGGDDSTAVQATTAAVTPGPGSAKKSDKTTPAPAKKDGKTTPAPAKLAPAAAPATPRATPQGTPTPAKKTKEEIRQEQQTAFCYSGRGVYFSNEGKTWTVEKSQVPEAEAAIANGTAPSDGTGWRRVTAEECAAYQNGAPIPQR